MMRGKIGAALALTAVLTLSACGGSSGGGTSQVGGTVSTTGGQAPSAQGSFAVYDWEPNVVAPPGVANIENASVSKAAAERLAAASKGTIVLREPAPIDIPQTKFDESKGLPRKYCVLRDRPALDASDVTSASVQIDPRTRAASIIVQLTPAGQKKFEALTFREAKRGSSTSISGAFKETIPPRYAIAVGHEILSILQLPAGSYTHGLRAPAMTIVGGFDAKQARQLADRIHPG